VKAYEFSDGDLRAGQDLLSRLHARSSGGGSGVGWSVVHGLCENAIYGGRVDDAHDIKILRAYLRSSFNAKVLPGAGRVGQRLGPFEMPSEAEFRAFVDVANALPDDDKPSLFGLPANIDRSRQRAASATVVGQLRALGRATAGAARFDREKWSKELTPILTLWKRLNQGNASTLQAKLQAPSGEVSKNLSLR